MKYRFLLQIALCLVVLQSHAQGTFDLNGYKYRVNLYKYKTYGFSASNQSEARKTNDWYEPAKNYNLLDNNYVNSNSNTNLNLSLNGYSFVNTERIQQVINYQAYLGLTNNSSQSKEKTKRQRADWSNNYWLSPSISILRRIYSGLKFKEFSTSVSFPNDASSNNYSNKTDRQRNLGFSINPNLQFELGFGNGRLEMIGDAAFANFWLDDMKNKKVIADYDAETLNNLAKTVTKVRNTRIIDYRFRSIVQVKMYDSLFRNSGLVKNPDINYYTTLYDNYLYANNFQRYSGKRKTWFTHGEVNTNFHQGSYRYTNMIKYYASTSFFTTRNLDLIAGFGYRVATEKAISLHKQKSRYTEFYIFAKSAYSSYHNRIIDTMIRMSNYQDLFQSLNASVSREISSGYYFNTRSYLEYGINCSILFSYMNAVKNYGIKSLNITPEIFGFVNYYYWFSPNVQLNISGNIGAKENFYQSKESIYSRRIHSQSTTTITPYFNISLSYTIY